jgi:hypothetical protein
MDTLHKHINSWLSKPFIWGECDCMLVLADWVLLVTGKDPAHDMRYTYDSRMSCQRETGYFTDPVKTVARCFEQNAGLQRTDNPVKGDVGVVEVPVDGRIQMAGGLFTGKSWAFKAPHGATTMQPIRVVAAWSVGYDPKKEY